MVSDGWARPPSTQERDDLGCIRARASDAKKEPPSPAAIKLITGRRQTEWTGATRCPNEDTASHKLESLIDRKRARFFRLYLPCRPLAERSPSSGHRRAETLRI